MAESGYIIRELKELKGFTGFIEEIVVEQLKLNRFGAASDLAKIFIIYEEGGFLLDLDFYIVDWDIQINYLFDFYGWGLLEKQGGFKITNTFGFGAKPNHPIHREYFEIIKENREASKKGTYFLSRCYDKTAGSTLFDTGPYIHALSYYRQSNKGNNVDISLDYDYNTFPLNHGEFEVKIKDSDPIKISYTAD